MPADRARLRRPAAFRRLALFPVPTAAAQPAGTTGQLLPLSPSLPPRSLALNAPLGTAVALTASLALVVSISLVHAAPAIAARLTAGADRAAARLEKATSFSVVDSGVVISYGVAARTVGEALAAIGVDLTDADAVDPPRETPLLPGLRITVQRSVPLTIAAAEGRVEARTRASTVAELLAEQGFVLGPLDRVEPPLSAAPPVGGTVRVLRVSERDEQELSLISFQTRTQYSSEVSPGSRYRVRAGIPGVLERLVRVVYEDEREVQRLPLADRVLRAAVDEIVAIARPSLPAPVLPPLPVVASIPAVPASGVPELPVKRTLTMIATAYDAGPASTGKSPGHPAYGITASGLRATYGVVAVDPSVIPFYTRLYIPGYGYAIAADTGGDIRGNRIDLFYPTYGEAIEWGRRTVPVYILE